MSKDVIAVAVAMYSKEKESLDKAVSKDIQIWANDCAMRGMGHSGSLTNGIWEREEDRARKLCRYFSETAIELALRHNKALTTETVEAIRKQAEDIIDIELGQTKASVADWAKRSMPGLESHYNEQYEWAKKNYRDDLEREFTIRSGLAGIDGVKTTPAEVPTSALIERDFAFVTDGELRAICQRDYEEVQRVEIAGAHKATIVLCGSLTEALLLEVIQIEEAKARASSKAPKRPLERWDLHDLLEVAIDLGLINPGAAVLAKGIKDYRNLIHPGKEVRTKFHVGPEEAAISRQFLELVIRDLAATQRISPTVFAPP